MGIATVSLRWTADEFWRSTPHEFWAAIEVIEERSAEIEKAAKKARQG